MSTRSVCHRYGGRTCSRVRCGGGVSAATRSSAACFACVRCRAWLAAWLVTAIMPSLMLRIFPKFRTAAALLSGFMAEPAGQSEVGTALQGDFCARQHNIYLKLIRLRASFALVKHHAADCVKAAARRWA
jgi:hypothetical protein